MAFSVRFTAAAAAATAIAACGGGTSTHSETRHAAPTPAAGVAELPAAEHPQTSQFPSPGRRSLRQLATLVSSTAQLSAANGTFTPGHRRRLAFALTDRDQHFI